MYPYSLQNNSLEIFPIFGDKGTREPLTIDYSIPEFKQVNPRDMEAMNAYNTELLQNTGKSWGVGGYLENRSHILSGTHIQKEGRIFHLGIDIIFPSGTDLYSPLDGVVYEKGYEAGDGNYGGYLIIKYTVSGSEFYTLYGHLSEKSITKNKILKKGEIFAKLGSENENGNWFPHLHLQVFTGKDIDIWKNKGYCTGEDIAYIKYICPDPSFLLRY